LAGAGQGAVLTHWAIAVPAWVCGTIGRGWSATPNATEQILSKRKNPKE